MIKHFATFFSPGTFFAETTTRPIDTWEPSVAAEMAREITERYGATPYAFQFSTSETDENDLDEWNRPKVKQTAKSGTYYLGGRILTLDDVKREMPDQPILISNMECNHWDRVIVNDNSWRSIQAFHEGDVLLDYAAPNSNAA